MIKVGSDHHYLYIINHCVTHSAPNFFFYPRIVIITDNLSEVSMSSCESETRQQK